MNYNIERIYEEILEYSFQQHFNSIWFCIAWDIEKHNPDVNESESYPLRKELFFILLKKLLVNGNIKMVWNNQQPDNIVDITIEESLSLLKKSWPPYPYEDELDGLDNFGLWFLVRSPLGIVWVDKDGKYWWT